MAKSKAKEFTAEDDALLDKLGIEAEQKQTATYTPKQERIIAGFEDIQRFVEEHGRPPQHGEDRDIFERLYAVRLDRIRSLAECVELLRPMDTGGLLCAEASGGVDAAEATDDELLEALGVDATLADDVTQLKHVRPQPDRKAPVEVAQRKPCADFEVFRPTFDKAQRDLNAGTRRTKKFESEGTIGIGEMFILDGQKVLVADADKAIMKEFGREDRRLRVIYDNGTESNLLLRSLQRALYKDERGRRILPPDAESAPLFSDQADEDDSQSGTIYIAQSLSDHPFVVEHRKHIHKIGVTGGEAKRRVANAKKDPTYLLADVEVVATYKLANVNRKKVEAILHQVFEPARLDLGLKDRFGSQVEPKEWFFVPLPIIDEAIRRLMDGTLEGCRYDPESNSLTRS